MSSKTTDHFSQIFSITLPANITEDESREKDDEIRKKLLHHKKYLPVAKAEDELFDANLHVNAGPEFARNYGAQNDGNIIVTIDNKKVKNPPFPSNFQECNFTKELLANIQRKRYMDPTQVQKAMILLIQKTKNDIIGNAQTGSGKTGAVLLPIIDEIHKDYIKGVAQFNSDSPYAIIIASTRELVAQMYEECLSFSIDTQIKTAVAYGDTPMEYSIRELHKGCDVFCTTIGRLCHYVREQIIYLHNVRYFIIDEADLFLNGQRPERFENLQYIKSQLPQNHRTFMISATFGERAELAAKEFLKAKYFFVRIPQTISTISHKFIKVEHYNKKDLLIKLLKERSTLNETDGLFDTEKTIVFKSGKREADRLGIALCYHGFRAIVIHKNKAQQLRFESVDNFTKGKYHIIVSSDNIIARGLNLPNVEHVINFDLPKTEDYNQYIHRVGRTGRAGNFGRATSFFDPTNVNDIQTAPFYAKILEDLNQPVPDFFNPIIKLQQQIREAHQNAREQVNGVQSQSNTNLASGSAELQDDENIFS